MNKISNNVQHVGLEEHLPNSIVESAQDQQIEFLRDKKIKKEKNYKKFIEPTELSRIFERTLKFLTVFGVLLGADYNYEWKCTKHFTITKILVLFFWFLNISTQILHVYNHTIIRTLEQFAIYGVGISAILKLKCFERSFKNITALFDSTQKLCQENKAARAVKLKGRLQANSTFFKMIASLAIVIAALFTFYPIKSYFFDKELVPFLPLDFIFLDQSTKFGFHMASFLMVILGCMAIVITEYMGLTFVMLIMNYALRVDIVEIDFNELDELWNNVSTSTLSLRQMLLRNICQKFNDMSKYINEIKNIFDQKMFVYFVFAYFSQILCLYQIQVNNWIPGYSLAIGFFMEMIFYCMMGTQITIDNERLCYIITQSKWYKYDNYSKKLIMFLLNAVMNTKELRIGTLKPLSVVTATEIVKSIYTYYTIMTEIL